MNRRLALLAAVAVAALAGCGAFAGGGTPEPVTPAPVPTTAAPVGAGANGDTIDASRIVERHERALANRSFTTHRRVRVRGPDGAVRLGLETTGKRDAAGHVRFDRRGSRATGARPVGRLQFYWEGGRTVYRYAFESGAVNVEAINQRPRRDLTRRDRLESMLSGLAVGRVVRYPSGDAEVSGTVRNLSVIPTAVGVTAPRNASLTARIGEDGVVQGIAVRYDATYRGNRSEVRDALAFENVSSTTVERPPWMAGLRETDS